MNEPIPAQGRNCPTGRALGAVLTLVGALAIATPSAAVELVPEAAVRQRSDQHWQAMVDGKYEDAYQFLAPSFRAVQSYKSYTSRFVNTAWTGGTAVRVECNDERDKCVATVRIDSKVFLPGMKMGDKQGSSLTTYVEENWIKQGGNWWLFPQS